MREDVGHPLCKEESLALAAKGLGFKFFHICYLSALGKSFNYCEPLLPRCRKCPSYLCRDAVIMK